MTNTRIANYDDLLQEKARLKALLQAQKELLKQDIQEIKEELKPVKTAISVIGKFTTRDKSNPLLTGAAEGVVDLLVKKLILARSGWLTRLVVPFLMKNFSSHIVNDNKDKLFSKLFSWFGKKEKDTDEDIDETVEGSMPEPPEEPVEEKAV